MALILVERYELNLLVGPLELALVGHREKNETGATAVTHLDLVTYKREKEKSVSSSMFD